MKIDIRWLIVFNAFSTIVFLWSYPTETETGHKFEIIIASLNSLLILLALFQIYAERKINAG